MLITVDVEDHGVDGEASRFATALHPLLELLRRNHIRATFFVVGSLAAAWAQALRELSTAGHEIGLHGYTHRHLHDLGPSDFRDELRRGIDALAETPAKGRSDFGLRTSR
jgi:peptidoglycan/xylan/chitin deacetylase (PgdA/CDA1 family)